MSMAEEYIANKTKNEIAASEDNIPPHEPKIYESGYFFLSQQISALKDSMDAKFDRLDSKFVEVHKEIKDLSNTMDARFEAARKESDARFEAARKESDAKFDKINSKFDAIHREISGLQRWAFALIATVIIGFAAIYFK